MWPSVTLSYRQLNAQAVRVSFDRSVAELGVGWPWRRRCFVPTADVRQARNDVMHSAKFEVTSADLTTYLATMTALMQEPAVNKYASARRAIVEITKIETLSLDINATAVNQLERSMWKAMVEEQTSNKQ
ncbi:hypothetical protein LSAT2_023923, partial [Lamellibrachia satsuma]